MTITAFALDAVSGAPAYTGQQWRAVLSALMGTAPSGRPLGASSGVRPGTPSTTVTATSTTWTVKTHSGIIDAESAAAAGAYLYAVTANETGSMTAANGSNPRIDLISVQISDPSQGDGTSTPQAAVVYTAGTAAASPAVPATPARAYPLAQISVPTSGGGSPSVTWIGSPWDDTGWITTGLSVSAASGWTLTYSGRIVHGVIYITFTGTRTGADITANSTGNITDTTVGTFNTYPPGSQQYESFLSIAGGTSGGSYLATSGDWVITDAHPGSVITSGTVVRSTFKYPI